MQVYLCLDLPSTIHPFHPYVQVPHIALMARLGVSEYHDPLPPKLSKVENVEGITTGSKRKILATRKRTTEKAKETTRKK
jgi:hypothetical protein